MWLVGILVAFFKAAWPLPNFKDEAAVTTWLGGLNPVLAKIIVTVAAQVGAQGKLSYGAEDYDNIAYAVIAELGAKPSELPSGMYERIGDGTLLKWLRENLPAIIALILQFVPK